MRKTSPVPTLVKSETTEICESFRMSPHLEPVAELEDIKTHADDEPASPTIEQFLYGTPAESSRRSSAVSPLSRKDNDINGEHPQQRKSLLSKMKSKARKLQHSLSHRKKGEMMSSQVVRQEDNEVGEEEDPEYLGAPMYESEMAPEELKETARQHPRADPVISEEHFCSIPAKQGVELEKEKPTDYDKTIPETIAEKTTTKSMPESFKPADVKEKPVSPSKRAAETVTKKRAPANAEVSDVTHAITPKIQGLAVSASIAERNDVSEINKHDTAGSVKPAGSDTRICSYDEHVWDKGLSVKEYIKHKFEPGEDDRALSQVISEAMSPRKTSDDAGVVGRVKRAVSSLIWDEVSNNTRGINSAPNSPLRVPISTNTHEIVEEENHGRIMQLN